MINEMMTSYINGKQMVKRKQYIKMYKYIKPRINSKRSANLLFYTINHPWKDIKKPYLYIHIKVRGLLEDIILFKCYHEMTVRNVLYIMKKRLNTTVDKLYLVEEQYENNVLDCTKGNQRLKWARTYVCKRQPKS